MRKYAKRQYVLADLHVMPMAECCGTQILLRAIRINSCSVVINEENQSCLSKHFVLRTFNATK